MSSSITAYRQLLRSAGQAFKGDSIVLAAARQEVRSKFEEARNVSDPSRIKQLVDEAQEAADFIRSAVVQAKLNDRGNYEMRVQPQHLGGVAEPVTEAKLPKVKPQQS